MHKSDARIYGKTIRKSITQEERKEKERLIKENFLSLNELNYATNVCAYFAIGSEVNVTEIISKLFELGKRVFAPVVRGDDMYAIEYKSGQFLDLGTFNIPEPKGEYLEKEKLDLIIVPMIAFNESRQRVGYGKGYYDRFLPDNALTVGIAFSEQECDFEPEKHDKKLDIIVTDKGVFR